jgi:general secretion pathway protein H
MRKNKYSPPFKPRPSAGFTLIELIVVLMIIGVSLGLAGLFVSKGTGYLELKRFAKEISTTLKFARNHAVSEKKIYSFIIKTGEDTYGLYTSDISGNADFEEATPVMSRTLPDKIIIDLKEKGEDSYRIDFFPSGNSSGGEIDISNQAGRALSVTVNRVTGKVDIKKKQD